MAAVTICSDFGAQKNKMQKTKCFHCFPIYFPWSGGTGYHDLCFLNLSFKPTFSLSTCTFFKRLLNSSSLSAIKVVLSACLRLLIFLPAILIPACVSSSPVFMYRWKRYLKLNNLHETKLLIKCESTIKIPWRMLGLGTFVIQRHTFWKKEKKNWRRTQFIRRVTHILKEIWV